MSTGDPRARTADSRPGGFCSSCGHALEAGATICTNCGAARVPSTDRDATIVLGPDPATEVVRERTYEYDDEPIVDDRPVVVADDTNWALWALAALGLLIVLFLLFLNMRDDDDDDVSTANGPVATAPGETVVPNTVATVPVRPAPTAAPSAPVTNAPTAGNTGSGQSSASGPVTQSPQTGAGFELADIQIEDDGGTFAGTAQVRNTRDEARSANVTVKLYKGGQLVGTLTGTSSAIPANSTAAVPLTSSDSYVDGVDRYEFTATEA